MKQKNETNKNLSNIKLSMSDYVKEIAKARASICFSGNVSAYITHLILQDFERGLSTQTINEGGVQIVGNASNTKISNRTKK